MARSAVGAMLNFDIDKIVQVYGEELGTSGVHGNRRGSAGCWRTPSGRLIATYKDEGRHFQKHRLPPKGPE